MLFIVKYIFALLIAQAIVGPETSKKMRDSILNATACYRRPDEVIRFMKSA